MVKLQYDMSFSISLICKDQFGYHTIYLYCGSLYPNTYCFDFKSTIGINVPDLRLNFE